MVISVSSWENGISRHEETFVVSIQQSSKITMNKFRVKINLILYFVVNFMIIMVILVFFMVISVNRRLFRYFGSYSGISVIPVILVNRRTDQFLILECVSLLVLEYLCNDAVSFSAKMEFTIVSNCSRTYSYPSSSRRLAVLVRSPKTLPSRNFSAFWQLWALGCNVSSSETAKKTIKTGICGLIKDIFLTPVLLLACLRLGGSREHVQVTCYPFLIGSNYFSIASCFGIIASDN